MQRDKSQGVVHVGQNLFFVAVVVGGLFALRASLFPLSTEARKVKFAPASRKRTTFARP